MALTRAYEEHEVADGLLPVYADARAAFDLPFVPSIFKLAAGAPAYLKLMWSDLAPVARSREFHAASADLEEFARSLAISGGWRFTDQQRILAGQKFSHNDVELLSLLASTFARALARMALFTRLMQRGYSGGQHGRVSAARQASALSRLASVHVPNERDAGLRVWLIYSDIKKTTGARHVPSAFRVLSPYPGYLASVWMESKKLLGKPGLLRARDQVARRALALLEGMPVRDHRALARGLAQSDWADIEDAVDTSARLLPQLALLSVVWQRSFPQRGGQYIAA